MSVRFLNREATTMPDKRPNILFIMTDDHAAHAMSCYGSRINETPNLDRIAEGGMRFDNCFCTNSICTPSRATILTGTYNHINGVTTLSTPMDNRLQTFPKLLQAGGYQTAMIGKWHLGHGELHRPDRLRLLERPARPGALPQPRDDRDGRASRSSRATPPTSSPTCRSTGCENRDPDRPFCLLCHHKAPAPPLGAGREARRHVRGRRHPRAGDLQRRLQQPGRGRGRGRPCASTATST